MSEFSWWDIGFLVFWIFMSIALPTIMIANFIQYRKMQKSRERLAFLVGQLDALKKLRQGNDSESA